MALTMPITNPARSACHHSSIEKSSSTAASSHNVSAPATVTRMTRHTTTLSEGRLPPAGAPARRCARRHAASGSGQPFAGREDADVVEQPDAIELGAEPLDGLEQPGRWPAADDRRAVGPPVDRDDQPGVEDPHRLGGTRGIEVALADGRTPTPDREQRDVHRRDGRHLVEQVGVAGEVDGLAGRPQHVADGGGGDPAVRTAPVLVPGRHGLDVDGADADRRADARSRTSLNPRRVSRSPAPSGAMTVVVGGRRRSDGMCMWSRWTWEIKMASTCSGAAVAACRRRWATRPVSTGSVSSRTSPSSARTVAWPTHVSCSEGSATSTASVRRRAAARDMTISLRYHDDPCWAGWVRLGGERCAAVRLVQPGVRTDGRSAGARSTTSAPGTGFALAARPVQAPCTFIDT